jgi:hypothetical protein
MATKRCAMKLRNGERCRNRVAEGSLCGIHRRSFRGKIQRAKTALKYVPATAVAANTLYDLVQHAIQLYQHAAPTVLHHLHFWHVAFKKAARAPRLDRRWHEARTAERLKWLSCTVREMRKKRDYSGIRVVGYEIVRDCELLRQGESWRPQRRGK